MHKSFLITEEEKSRILGLHQVATSTQYLKENEEDWISQSEDMSTDTDFSKMDLETAKEELDDTLTHSELRFLGNLAEYKGEDELKNMIMNVLSTMENETENTDNEYEEVNENSENEFGMSNEELKLRGILDKIVQNTTLLSALGIIPAMMFVGGGAALALGIVALAGVTLKDSAFFKRKGYDKFGTGHHYGASDKSRMDSK